MFQRKIRLHSASLIALMMVAVHTSETLVNSHQSTRRYNPAGSHLHGQAIIFKTIVAIKDFKVTV
jgi:hypothetical protein